MRLPRLTSYNGLWFIPLLLLPAASSAQLITASRETSAPVVTKAPTAPKADVLDFVLPDAWIRNYPSTEYVLSARSAARLRAKGVYAAVPAFVGLRRKPLDRESFSLDRELTVLRKVYDQANPTQLPLQLSGYEIKVYRLEAKETHLHRHYLVMFLGKKDVYQADVLIPRFATDTAEKLEQDAITALNSLQLPS